MIAAASAQQSPSGEGEGDGRRHEAKPHTPPTDGCSSAQTVVDCTVSKKSERLNSAFGFSAVFARPGMDVHETRKTSSWPSTAPGEQGATGLRPEKARRRVPSWRAAHRRPRPTGTGPRGRRAKGIRLCQNTFEGIEGASFHQTSAAAWCCK